MANKIFTNLIGSGHISDGALIATPARPWVVWNGVATRSTPVRFKIKNKALYELDEITPASIPPSYVPSGVTDPLVIFPENNFYKVQIFIKGKPRHSGFWQIPYDPQNNGTLWYKLLQQDQTQEYISSGRYNTDSVLTYNSSGDMIADADNILEGTILYTTAGGVYWGKKSIGFTPFTSVPGYVSSGEIQWALMHIGYGATPLGGGGSITTIDKITMLGIYNPDLAQGTIPDLYMWGAMHIGYGGLPLGGSGTLTTLEKVIMLGMYNSSFA